MHKAIGISQLFLKHEFQQPFHRAIRRNQFFASLLELVKVACAESTETGVGCTIALG